MGVGRRRTPGIPGYSAREIPILLSKVRLMHLKVIACDLDGTLTDERHPSPETWDLLRRVQSKGFKIVLVTGRVLESFIGGGPYSDVCEAIVAENGAVVHFPKSAQVHLPFGRLSLQMVRAVEKLDIPLERGQAILSTHVPHDLAVLKLLHELRGGATVEFNRGAVMILPPGATKGAGLSFALRELGLSQRNVVACGDAENDRSLFETVELAVAVANASADIQRLADSVLSKPNGQGVRNLLAGMLEGRLPPRRVRLSRRMHLGERDTDIPVHLDPFLVLNKNLGIAGSSTSGKSYLAGLVAEELLKLGYQICILDPEGDYRGLKAFPHTLVLGGADSELPSPVEIVTLCEYGRTSVALDLSALSPQARVSYGEAVLRGLSALRARVGRPHWFLIDEIQNFCPLEGGAFADALLPPLSEGGFALVTYRPSLLHSRILSHLENWLITQMNLLEEIEAIDGVLCSSGGKGPDPAGLRMLGLGEAYLCLSADEEWLAPSYGAVKLRAASRAVPHIRHLHKYMRAPLPTDKRFEFRDGAGRHFGSAASLWEFLEAIKAAPADSVQFHLHRGDFERWAGKALRDQDLSRKLRKLANRRLDKTESREALYSLVEAHYRELESLI
jgi:phosphoglycolate phosphatase (TIGR01487 family)